MPGDYDGDGKTDIAFYCPGCGWNTVPVLFSNGDGTWRSTNAPTPDWANQSGVIAVHSDYGFGVPAHPPLSFDPSNMTLGPGNSQPAELKIPNAICTDATAVLQPASANVSVGGQPPGAVATVIIPQGANASAGFSVQGVQPGNSTVVASATGFQNGVLNVTVSSPPQSYSLALAGPNQDVHFGDTATFTATLTPINGFMNVVALSTPNQPSLTQGGWSFSPSASIDAGSRDLSRTLHGTVKPSLFSPGSNTIVVQGVAPNGLRASAMSTLMVAHSQGDFTHVYPQPQVPAAAQTDCVDGPAHVHASFTSFGTNDFRVQFSRTDLPGAPATANTPAVFFLISQHCRIGVALNGVGLQQTVDLFDLGFTAAPGWNIRNAHTLPPNALRQQYWFSQDDSLLVVVRVIRQTSLLPPGTQPGTIWDYGATLIDPITGSPIGSEQQFSSLTLVADIKEMQAEANGTQFNVNQNGMLRDPDPDPNQAAPVIADIYKIELVRDPGSGALQAEGTFRILNGQLDGTNFDHELGAHPDHFAKFVLHVP